MNLLTDVLQSQITRLQEEVRGLASWRTGIVQTVSPPTVLFPRDTVATPADTLTQQIQPGQVVLTLTLLRRVWIVGIRGGSTFFPRLGIGKTWGRGALDVAGDVYINSAKLEMTPTKTDITSQCTPGAGWELTGSVVVTQIGKVCQIYMSSAKRTGGAITVSTSGDISNQTLISIPAAWRPADTSPMSSVATGRLSVGYLNTGGSMVVTAVGGSANIATGDSISLSGTYILP